MTELHPGPYMRENVLPKGMNVSEAARLLGVARPALSNMLNGKASLSPEMAMRFEKTFGASSQDLLAKQAAYDEMLARQREPALAVRAYVPSFLDIKAIQIEAWADRQEARAELAVLIRRLVASTVQNLTKLDFPAYENSQRHGWDGYVESGSSNPWVPLGTSGWEFGVNQVPATKAEGDYVGRLTEADKEVTFVFVTPRRWPGKDAWAAEKRKDRLWKDVRAFDASDLEQWLEQSVPAQAWLSERLPQGDAGIQSLEGFWNQWAQATEPPMSKLLFRGACETWSKGLAKWLAEPPGEPFTIVADSVNEGVAFLAAAFEGEDLKALGAGDKTVVVHSADATSKVATALSDFIIVVASAEAEVESAGLQRQQHVIVVSRRNAVEGEPRVTLDLIGGDTFRTSLEAMGFEREEIERLGHESGHSMTVLRRRLSKIPAIKAPPWANQPEIAKSLIPMTFLGAWDSSSPADQAILEEISGQKHDAMEQAIAALAGAEDSPIWSIARFRGVVSKVDAFYAVQSLVTASDLDRFFRVARVVLSEVDPALDLPEDKRWASNLYGKSRKHSGALRDGICETLVLLTTHGENLFQSRIGYNVKASVDKLIKELLTPLDGTTWQSQQHHLPRYAEASPDAFLDLLEADLKSADPKVYSLMQPASAGVFGRCDRTGLLWALEGLAWNPLRLGRVVTILAKLAEVTLNDNWANKPENTLLGIFRSWMPQTAADVDERIAALRLLIRKNPAMGWQVCIEQFDPHATVGHYNHRPRWRRDSLGFGNGASGADRFKMVRAAIDIAIAWPEHTPQTLGDLIERLAGVAPEDQVKIWAAVQDWADKTSDEESRANLRERIRQRTLTRRALKKGKGSGFAAQAKEAFDALLPKDLVLRHRWLFQKQWVEESADEIAEEDFDFEKRDKRISAQRVDAMREIWQQRGYAGVVELCGLSESPWTIGQFVARITSEEEQLAFLIASVGESEEAMARQMAQCLSGMLSQLADEARGALLKAAFAAIKAEANSVADRTVAVLRCAPFDAQTWAFVDKLPKAERTRYWKTVTPYWARQSAEELNRLVKELLEVERPRAAFATVHMDFEEIETPLLIRLLEEAGTSRAEPLGHYRLDTHYISDAFEKLSGRSDVPRNELIRLEFLFISALDHTKHGIKNLERELSEAPELFAQALALAFKRNDGGEDPPEYRVGDSTDGSGAASAAYSLLSNAKRIPGTDDAGTIDAGKLRAWLSKAREMAISLGREGVGDSVIGQLLGRGPIGKDGIWPSEPVREALEDLGTPEIANGMTIGLYNSRGATWRGEGGDQEKTLAQKYRLWARSLASQYPFTARMLESVASMYDSDAAWHDSDDRVRKRLWH